MSAVMSLPRDQSVSWPPRRPLTRDDLDTMPDDGHRYEVIDGALIMTPAPSPQHQIVLANLVSVMTACCPEDLRVLSAPLDVAIAEERPGARRTGSSIPTRRV
jgi:hypothetical protein